MKSISIAINSEEINCKKYLVVWFEIQDQIFAVRSVWMWNLVLGSKGIETHYGYITLMSKMKAHQINLIKIMNRTLDFLSNFIL